MTFKSSPIDRDDRSLILQNFLVISIQIKQPTNLHAKSQYSLFSLECMLLGVKAA